jgi:dUTP pyrophosphatase
MRIKIKTLPHCFAAPEYKTNGSVGADLYAAENKIVQHGEIFLFRTGVCIEIPPGFKGQVFGRSGLSTKGYLVLPGTIDQDYRGEIGVILLNSGTDFRQVLIRRGERIAQLVISPVIQADFESDELGSTERGENGFGSTGA